MRLEWHKAGKNMNLGSLAIDKKKSSDIIRDSAVFIVLIMMSIMFSIISPSFHTFSNLITILRQMSMLGIIAAGMMIVLISGGIDLSVSSTLSIVGVITSISVVNWGFPSYLGIIFGLLFGTMIGVINGLIITKTGTPAMIATLAMQILIRGFSFIICGGISIYGLPESYRFFGQGYIGKIPVPVIIMLVILVIIGFVLNKTYHGRYFFAVGSNKEAARLSGLNINKIQILSYTICGFLSSLAGIIMMSRVNSGQPKAGDGFEMDVLTACVVGGVSINGGEGKISNVLIGVLIIGVLSNGLIIAGVSEYWQQVAKGAVLLFAVSFDSFQRLKAKKTA